MSLALTEVRAATDREWDAIQGASDGATFFHSREWAEIWRNYTGGAIRPEPRLLGFSDGAEALLPVCRHRRMLGLDQEFLSSPAGTYGGWIAARTLTPGHAALAAERMLADYDHLEWRLNPYDPALHDLELPRAQTGNDPEVLSLAGGFAPILESWSRRGGVVGRNIRKATREGVRTRLARDLKDWQDYFAAYQHAQKRWGEDASSNYKWRLFEEMHRRASPNIRLWLAEHESRIIAGCLCVEAKNNVIYWHGAALEQFFHLRPVNLLIHDIVADACDRGMAWFDFNPSGGHAGVLAFKRSFGTQSLPSPVVDCRGARGFSGLVGAIRRKLR